VGSHVFTARAGHHLAPRQLSSGRDLYEALGPSFTLVALDADPADIDGFETAAADLGVPLTVVADSRADGREKLGARLVLVRPDQFVAWAGDTMPAQAKAILAKAAGLKLPG